jgi:hypothetical protein
MAGDHSLGIPLENRGVALSERIESKGDGNGAPGLPGGLHSIAGAGMTLLRKQKPLLISLLEAASRDRENFPLAGCAEAQVMRALKTGLGPLLVHTTRADPGAQRSTLWSQLKAADLTARMISAEMTGAMKEIIDACEGYVPPLTLLKGISICDQYYPKPHLRLMRDIDFLVEENALPVVNKILSELGYFQPSTNRGDSYATHHHGAPYYHPKKHLWLEVHRGLVPPRSRLGTEKVFSLENLRSQIRPSLIAGRKVNRLSDELQIVYIACHWAGHFDSISGMVAMLDVIYLLKNIDAKLDWGKILTWMHGSVASAYVYLLLSYLHQYELIRIEPEVLRELSLNGRSFGRANLKILYRLIDYCLVEGRARGFFFSLRNLDIAWRTCLLPGTTICNLMLVPMFLFMPFRFRKTVLAWSAGENIRFSQ